MPKRTAPSDIRPSAPSILEFYRIGRDSLKNDATRVHAIEKEAQERGMNIDTLRKARAFARLYSRHEVNGMWQLRQKHNNTSFGHSHISQLIVLSKPQRAKLQRQAIQQHWSLRQLILHIRMAIGKRQYGGRPWPVPKDKDAAYFQILKLSGSWRRYCQALGMDAVNGEEKVEGIWPKLPPTVRERLQAAREHMAELEKTVKSQWKRQSGKEQ